MGKNGSRGINGLSILWIFLMGACMSVQSPEMKQSSAPATVTEKAPGTVLEPKQEQMKVYPYVEAYIEYPGPREKWVGPSSFMVQVNAKGTGNVEIATSPLLPIGTIVGAKKHPGRVIAKKEKEKEKVEKANTVPVLLKDDARESLGKFAAVLGEETPRFKACLYPIRVRLIRADGAIIEKQGCRADKGWPRAASELVNTFMASYQPPPSVVD